MLTAVASDGIPVRADEAGNGPPIIVLNPGMDVKGWDKPASLLAARYRVIQVHRRQYRLDLPRASHWSISDEAADVVAVAHAIGAPSVLVGHSSGGVVALEALLASPASFAGLLLYEPPIPTGPTLGGSATHTCTALLAAGRPGKAIATFMREVVQIPSWMGSPCAMFALYPPMRSLIPRQIDDLVAIDELGNRLAAYARIQLPVLLLGGDRSPRHLAARLDALELVLPDSERVVMRGQGHAASRRSPAQVAGIVETLADRVLR